ncbi:hypothetical protein D770_15240 [Flammeovirgaceae bacterium 311]|nr:hypothetical protein D770_15240 [Flammeovirgaceae bacterium 311]
MVSALIGTSACTNSRGLAEADDPVVYEDLANIPGAYNLKASDEVRADKEKLNEELNQKLAQVDQRIEALEDKAKTVPDAEKLRYAQVIEQLDEEREKLVAEYNTIQAATDDEWDDVKSEVREVMNNVDQSVTNLAARLER